MTTAGFTTAKWWRSWTGTAFIENYLAAARSLRFSADGKYVYNPTATTIYGCAYAHIYAQRADANVILSPGETVAL